MISKCGLLKTHPQEGLGPSIVEKRRFPPVKFQDVETRLQMSGENRIRLRDCLKIFLLIFLYISIIAPSVARSQTLFEETLELYRELDSNSEKANRSENWDIVGRNFYRMYSHYPLWEKAPLCLFLAAEVYEKKAFRFNSPQDTEKALGYSWEFARRYWLDHPLTDDSLLRIGRISERIGNKDLAIEMYAIIFYEIPGADTYEIAAKRLLALGKSWPSGTGFLISGKKGLVLTNEHVVKPCYRIEVEWKTLKIPASVVNTDSENDIALIKVYREKLWNSRSNKWLDSAKRNIPTIESGLLRKEKIKLGEDILVAGFPYGDILDSIKVTKGIVSGKTGLHNHGQFQIDAAVQPGNSGGPVYDKNGNIVGIVVGQLDKLYFARRGESLPENTNFAIKADIVRNFLDTSGIKSTSSVKNTALNTEKLASIAERQTVRINCYRY